MLYYVVTYDIPNDKRRNLISTILEAYGVRVNYSVFELMIKTKAQKDELVFKLLKELKPKEDSLRFYNIHKNSIQKSWSLGDEPAPFDSEAVYFI